LKEQLENTIAQHEKIAAAIEMASEPGADAGSEGKTAPLAS
jgi:hypothetical protein